MTQPPDSLAELLATIIKSIDDIELKKAGLADGPAETRQAREDETRQAESDVMARMREVLRQSIIVIINWEIPELQTRIPRGADAAAIREAVARVRPSWEIPPGSDLRTFAAIARLIGEEQARGGAGGPRGRHENPGPNSPTDVV